MGLTVLDAGVVIGFLDANDAHHSRAHQELAAALGANDKLVVPASALTETLVGPSRRGPEAVAVARRFIDRIPIEIAPLDGDIATDAAALRANHGSLKLPDALVIATARMLGADLLVTTDRKWPTPQRLQLGAKIRTL
jgi:predicted nucleic acid-binding protein